MKFINLFGKQKLLLSFEYGVILSQVAKEQGIELIPEILKRAEEIILDSFKRNSSEKVAIDMLPNILAIFETNMDK